MNSLGLCTLMIVITAPLLHSKKLHALSLDEANEIFNKPIESEFDYDVISIAHTLHKRSSNPSMRLRVFDQDYQLFLEPNNNTLFGKNTPVYLAYKDLTSDSGVRYARYNHDLNFKLYQDKTKNAAFMIQNNKGRFEIRGIINDMLIRPIPLGKKYRYRLKRSFFNKPLLAKTNETVLQDHVVMRIKYNPINNLKTRSPLDVIKTKANFTEPSNKISYKTTSFAANVSDIIVYPEILVTTDFKTFSDHGKNIDNYIKYMVVYWNAVDLKFRSVSPTKIRLNIAGLVIPQEEDAVPYIKSQVYENNNVWDDHTLEELSKFYYKENAIPKNSYDVVVHITNYIMIAEIDGQITDSPNGIAYLGCACMRLDDLKEFAGVALVEDDKQFAGVFANAHELGHLFGASHDGTPSPYKSIPGAENCQFEEGYIMSYENSNVNAHYWSPCSLRSMNTFLTSNQASCMRNKPVVSEPYPKILAGSIASLEDQCNALVEGSTPCHDLNMNSSDKNERNICQTLYCRLPGMTRCVSRRPALDGSPCNANQGICLRGECVRIPRNFLRFSNLG